ncbi:MAG: serine/threonine-protein phosphatase [Lachnospiraceae bacterium]|nr:serine/threonine-protein phosphatase [Lachnospiraceae bacterium]
MAKHLIKSQTMADGADPVKIFTAVNSMLMEENEAMLFVTAFLGILTLSTGHMVSANAGHEYPAVRRKDGLFYYEQDAHAMPLAIRKKNKFVEHELTLQPGDTLYLFTEGITEASDRDEEMFQKERLLDVLNENPDAEPRELDILVRQRVSEFVADAEQLDDMTTLCLKYFGPQKELVDE